MFLKFGNYRGERFFRYCCVFWDKLFVFFEFSFFLGGVFGGRLGLFRVDGFWDFRSGVGVVCESGLVRLVRMISFKGLIRLVLD